MGITDPKTGMLTPGAAAIAGLAGGLLGLSGGSPQSQGSQGYTGGIPELTAQRSLVPNAFDSTGRRPGEAGRRYFTSQAASNLYASPGMNAAGTPRVMGQNYLDRLAAGAAANTEATNLQNLNALAMLLGVDVNDLPDYFKNRAAGTTGGGTIDPLAPSFDPATGNKIMPRAGGLPALTLTPYREGFEPPSTLSGGVIPGTETDMYEPAYNALNQILAGKNTLAEQIEVFDRFGISDATAAKYLGMQPSDLVTARENIQNKKIADAATAEKAKTDAFNQKYPEAPEGMEPAKNYMSGAPIIRNKDGAWRGTDGKYYRGNPPGFAGGGLASLGGRGYYLGGTTDGMADKVPATIDGREPARLSDGEFVIPADVVSHLGNGNSDAGAKNLYSMMDRVRKARTGTTKQGRQINPQKYLG